MKTKQILLLGGLLAASIGGGIYFTQYYPEHAEIRQLEKQIQANYYGGIPISEDENNKDIPPERLRVLAEKGYSVAQYQLAEFYKENENISLAKKWFEKAAEQKLARAYVQLANMEEDNSPQKIEYLKKAEALGDLEAKYLLAMFIKDDNLTQIMLLEEVAHKGYFDAMWGLGLIYNNYNNRIRIEQNWDKAFYWYQKAYDRAKTLNIYTLIDIHRELAIFHLLGIATPPNKAKAEQLLVERKRLKEKLGEDSILYAIRNDITLDDLKLDILTMDIPKKYQEQVAILEAELGANNAEFWLNVANKAEDKSKAKQFFGRACDKGNQEGCDKYRELNEKGVK